MRFIATAMFCHSFTHRGAEENVMRGPNANEDLKSHTEKTSCVRLAIPFPETGPQMNGPFYRPGKIKNEVFDPFFANCGFLLVPRTTHPRPSGPPTHNLLSLLNLDHRSAPYSSWPPPSARALWWNHCKVLPEKKKIMPEYENSSYFEARTQRDVVVLRLFNPC